MGRREHLTGRAVSAILPVLALLSLIHYSAPGFPTGRSSGPFAATESGILQVTPAAIVINQPCEGDSPVITPGSSWNRQGEGNDLVRVAPFRRVGGVAAGTGNMLVTDWTSVANLAVGSMAIVERFPLDELTQVELILESFTVFGDKTEFLTGTDAGDVPCQAPAVTLLRGQVVGDPGSHVFLGVGPSMSHGYVRTRGTAYVLSSGPPGGAMAAAGRSVLAPLEGDFRGAPEDLACAVLPDLGEPDFLSASGSVDTLPPLLWRCKLAIEGDYEYFQRMGGDLDAAMAYAALLIGAASEIYERDVSTALWLTYVRVWTTVNDPYNACGLNGLDEFKSYANANLLHKDWHLAHRMSGCGGGGAAHLGALCSAGGVRGRNPYSVSTIQGYFPYPFKSAPDNWDLYLVTHELGHNFGSRHTQCYYPPIDHCRGTESGCYIGPEECQRGTIMSYCFRCNGMTDIDLEFHPRVAQRLREILRTSCLEIVGDGILISNSSGEMMTIDSVTSDGPWLTTGPRAFLLLPGASRVIGVLADWAKIPAGTVQGDVVIHARAGETSTTARTTVTATRLRPHADFAAAADSGCWPLTIAFEDRSTNSPEAWGWTFGDGASSTDQHPVHTYSRAGMYHVTLTARNACGPDVSQSLRVSVTEAALCCPLSPILIERHDSLPVALDLWACAHDPIGPMDANTYEIVSIDKDSCGASIREHRYLGITPRGGWYGRARIDMLATDVYGCHCAAVLNVIVNDPPQIRLLTPGPGVDTINGNYDIRWTDSDGDDNARITLFVAEAEACSGGERIHAEEIFENQDGAGGSYRWILAGIPDGHYRINAVIADAFASRADCSDGIILIDRTPPVTGASMMCTQEEANGWCDGAVLVELTADDNLTGVSATYYSVNGARDQVYTGPFLVALEGGTTLDYYSVDHAGNSEMRRRTSEPVRVDTSPPAITGMQADNNRFASGDFTSSTPTFSIQLTDAGVGLAPDHITVGISPGAGTGPLQFSPGTEGFSFDPVTRRISVTVQQPLLPGPQTMFVQVTDRLMNSATAQLEFTIGTSLELLDVVNHPNPFVRETWFTFKITEDAKVTIRIYDLSGELMRTLDNLNALTGYNEFRWDGLSQSGLSLANGAYFYEITAVGTSGTIRHLDKLAILR